MYYNMSHVRFLEGGERTHLMSRLSSTRAGPANGAVVRAVVTGAAGGLGSAFVDVLRARGYEVTGADLAGADAVLDVTDADACRRLAREVQPDVWVNNAGVLEAGTVTELTDAEIERIVQVNLLGVIHGTRAAVEIMSKRGAGRVLNVASLASAARVDPALPRRTRSPDRHRAQPVPARRPAVREGRTPQPGTHARDDHEERRVIAVSSEQFEDRHAMSGGQCR